jgi:FAD/FMN-containing dehydrogenase
LGFEINKQAMIVRTPVEAKVSDLESFLGRYGFTLGAFQPPVGTDPAFTVAGWLNDPLIPPCNWAGGTLLERIVSVTAEGRSGRLVTNMAPRSATGPDLNYLLASTIGTLARIRVLWLRVRPAPVKRAEVILHFDRLGHALGALAALAHRKAHLESAHFVSQGGFHTLVLVHDEGTDLGRARAKFADSIVRAAGGVNAEAGVSVDRNDPKGGAGLVVKVENLPSNAADVISLFGTGDARARAVELYAPYSRSVELDNAAAELAGLGARCGVVYRYGTEGCSILFMFDADADRAAALDSPAGAAMMVRGGGAFLTAGANPALSSVFERLRQGLNG